MLSLRKVVRRHYTFMDMPSNKPAALVRLPPVASAILQANSKKDKEAAAATHTTAPGATAIPEDDRSDAASSAPPELSASTSTLNTIETAETELTPPSSAADVALVSLEKTISKKKAKQLAAEKRKRRREKERLAKQAAAIHSGADVGPTAGDEEDDDGRAAAVAEFRQRSASSASSAPAGVIVSLPSPAASTSKLFAQPPVAVWADELPDDTPIMHHDFNQSAQGPAGKSRTQGPPSAVARSRCNSVSSIHNGGLSRRASHVSEDRFSDSRPYSPASSVGGWQEVQSRAIKKPALGGMRASNAFVKRSINKEPIWTHDKFEEQRAYERAEQDRHERQRHPRVDPLELVARPPEPPWTIRTSYPWLFMEEGSRSGVDEKTGQRVLSLRISLRPVPPAIPPTPFNKRAARQRANVVEVGCFLRVSPPPPSKPTPLSEDASIRLKLDRKSVAIDVPSQAARAKRMREAALPATEEERPSSSQQVHETPFPSQEDNADRLASSVIASSRLPSREASQQGVLYASAPPSTHPTASQALDEASAQLRSAVMTPLEESSSSAHIPSVEQQMAAQDQQHQGLPPEAFYSPDGFPVQQFPMYHEPFVGIDGFTYYFDYATGQSVPGPPLTFPAYPFDTPPPASPVPFLPPRKSHKLEIKAPTPELLAESRSKPRSKHRSQLSTRSHLSQSQMEETGLQDFMVPGSFESGGIVYFTPATYVPPYGTPAPFFAPPLPTGIQDPAILAVGNPQPDPALMSPALPQANGP